MKQRIIKSCDLIKLLVDITFTIAGAFISVKALWRRCILIDHLDAGSRDDVDHFQNRISVLFPGTVK